MASPIYASLMDAPQTTKMEYVRLGNSGLKISKIILGAMSYGSKSWADWVLEEDEALPLLKHAYDVGINTWDTANMYSDGRSEELIAKAISTFTIPRESLVIMSKCRFAASGEGEPALSLFTARSNDGRMVNRVGLSRKYIFNAVKESVRRLGTYIDVLQIHRMDPDVPYEEIMRALHDVVEKGWVRYLGASSMPAWEFQMLQNVAERNGWHKFVSMQNYHNLIYREEEREMIPYCKKTGVGLIPWSPNARGLLTRPWGSKSEQGNRGETDVAFSILRLREEGANKAIIDAVEEVAKERKMPMAAVATAWSLSKGMNPIVGLNSISRIDEIVDAAKLELTKEEIDRLEAEYLPKNVFTF